MNKPNPEVDGYFSRAKKWQEELARLRTILLDSPLTEELKWYQPCYTLQGKNVLLIHGLKDAFALAFLKGSLMQDEHGLLTKPGENTQSGRWMKFSSLQEVVEREAIVRAYVQEAVEIERSGREVVLKTTADYAVPDELQRKLDTSPNFRHAFDALTPGRQRGYLLHFAAPKQSKTRAARIEKWTPQILNGRGMHDR
ncbi:MAG: YdeI/OmpD-associated family protein [Rhodospirillales bacterium]|nr:YdeI/OmpD-associated family protein [Acetobacter sp.]